MADWKKDFITFHVKGKKESKNSWLNKNQGLEHSHDKPSNLAQDWTEANLQEDTEEDTRADSLEDKEPG